MCPSTLNRTCTQIVSLYEGDWQRLHQVAALLIYLQFFSSTTEISILLINNEEHDNESCTSMYTLSEHYNTVKRLVL